MRYPEFSWEKKFRRWMLSRGYSPATIQRTVTYLKYIQTCGLDLEGLTDENAPDVIYEFFGMMRERGVTPKTLNNHVRVLNRWLNFKGIDYKLKYYREYHEETIRIPSDEEVRAILGVRWSWKESDLRNRAILALLFSTGIRIGELISLNWSDLEETPVGYFLVVRHGKGGKPRRVPVPPRVVALLMEYKNVQTKSDPNAMFTTPRGRISHAYARKIVKVAGIRAGVPWFHAHAARHWRAKKWLQQGVSLEAIRRLLGHSSLKVTQIYLNMTYDEILEEVFEKDTFFGGFARGGFKSSPGHRGEKAENGGGACV